MISVRNRLTLREAVLLIGDVLCFFAFAVLGLRSHEDGITLNGVLRAATPFQAGWLLMSFVLGTYRVGAGDSRRVVRTWVPAWALGLVLRTVFFDRSFEATFAVVSLLVNGVLLLLWRGLLAPLVLRRG